MPPVDFQRLGQLFDQARVLQGAERAAFIDNQAPAPSAIRTELEHLLALHETEDKPLEVLGDATRSLMNELAEDDVPSVIGPYRIVREIGAGGMGLVYLAEQCAPLKRSVALKVIRLGMNSREVVARFERERQSLARLSHPGIAQVFDAGTLRDGRPYFAMEYVHGQPITTWCDEQRLSPEARMQLFVEVCQAVEHAHQKGIIHRDLKPTNVLVMRDEDKPLSKVPLSKIIDFGIARPTDQGEGWTEYTEVGRFVGTPAYMSPEQASLDSTDVDTRTDIYSLGVILYELLVGALPFDPKHLAKVGYDEMQRVIREDNPLRPSVRFERMGETSTTSAQQRSVDTPTLVRRLRGDLDWITMKALEKDRTRRYASAGAFAQDVVRHLANEPVEARPPHRRYRLRKFATRHRRGVIAGAIGVSILMAGLWISTRVSMRAENALRQSEQRLTKAQQLADRQLLSDLRLDADRLWPAIPRLIPDMQRWLARAQGVSGRLPAFRRRRTALASQARPTNQVPEPETVRMLRAERASKLRALALLQPRTEITPATQAHAFGFRHTFELPAGPTESLALRAHIHAGAVIYLNNAEVARLNLPKGSLDATTRPVGPASPEATTVAVPASSLVVGRNVLAVRVIRSDPTQRLHMSLDVADPAGASLVSIDATWRFAPLTATASPEWTRSAFDDAAWRRGSGPIGTPTLDDTHASRARALEREIKALERSIQPLAQRAARRSLQFDRPAMQDEYRTLTRLVDALESMTATDGLAADVRARLVRAQRVAAEPTVQTRLAWQAAAKALASDPRFKDVTLTPQVGLMPIGADPASGLQEFAVEGSGTAPSREASGALRLDSDVAVVLVLLPGGSLWMGATSEGSDGVRNFDPQSTPTEGPVHALTLEPFFCSKFEMTQAQYLRTMRANPSAMATGDPVGEHIVSPRNPVESVTWHHARAAAERLGLVLPTEAQWEYAARAGAASSVLTPEQHEQLAGHVNIADAAAVRDGVPWAANASHTHDDGHVCHAPVGTYPANTWGLHETLGNVREWCLDRFGSYKSPARCGDGLRCEFAHDLFVARGAYFGASVASMRITMRNSRKDGAADDSIGLRPARSLVR